MSKGEVRRCEWGWEGDVFTFCFYHGKFLRFDDANAKKIIYKSGFDENRWNAARRKATELVKRWAEMDPREKAARLRKRLKGSDVPIRFEC